MKLATNRGNLRVGEGKWEELRYKKEKCRNVHEDKLEVWIVI